MTSNGQLPHSKGVLIQNDCVLQSIEHTLNNNRSTIFFHSSTFVTKVLWSCQRGSLPERISTWESLSEELLFCGKFFLLRDGQSSSNYLRIDDNTLFIAGHTGFNSSNSLWLQSERRFQMRFSVQELRTCWLTLWPYSVHWYCLPFQRVTFRFMIFTHLQSCTWNDDRQDLRMQIGRLSLAVTVVQCVRQSVRQWGTGF